MKKLFVWFLGFMLVVWLATTWLFGQQAQRIQEDVLETAEFNGEVQSAEQSFSRGLFSTQTQGRLVAADGDVQLSWQQTTDHGPLPVQRFLDGEFDPTPVQARFAVDVLFTLQTLVGEIKPDKPLQLTTTVGLFGDLVGSMRFAGLDETLQDKTRVISGSVDGRYDHTINDGGLRFGLNGESLLFTKLTQSLDITHPAVTCDLSMSSAPVTTGKCVLKTRRVVYTGFAESIPQLDSVEPLLSVKAVPVGDWLNTDVGFAAPQVTLADLTLEKIDSLATINGIAKDALSEFMGSITVNGLPADPQDWRPLLAGLFNAGEPSLSLKAQAHRQDQQFNLDAGVEVSPGLLGNGSTFALMSAIETWVNMDIHKALLDDVLTSQSRANDTVVGIEPLNDEPSAQVARWVELGILVGDGDRWKLDMAYHLGVISLNGKTINPVEFMKKSRQ